MSDRFVGEWLVTEYVHDLGGCFIDAVRQRRTLEPLTGDRIRVTQHCEPGKALQGHRMADFAGTWVFEMAIKESLRTYEGPDVVGYGTEWLPGAMTSQGVWPLFGCTFESYAVLVAPERQLTGGTFTEAGRFVADIVGVAVPDHGEWPELDLATEPPTLPSTAPAVTRRVGPMAVTETWPSPTERLRTLAITDATTRQSVAITDRHTPQSRHVQVSVEPIEL